MFVLNVVFLWKEGVIELTSYQTSSRSKWRQNIPEHYGKFELINKYEKKI